MTGKHAELIVCISIHAPPRGATGAMMKSMGIADISIHAPPRGATGDGKQEAQATYFNSRPSARGDRRYAKFPRCIFGNPAQRKNSKKVGKEV